MEKKLADITRELNNLENQYSYALDTANIGIWTWNFKKNHVTWGKRMLKIFEIDNIEFHNSLGIFYKSIHPEDYNMVEKAISHCIDSKEPYDIVYRIKVKTGIKLIRSKGKIILAPDGSDDTLVGICFEELPLCIRAPTCELCHAIKKGDIETAQKYISAIKLAII